MARVLIAYASRYGSTKQYANWLGESLGADVFPVEDIDPKQLENYDTVIVGGWVRIGKIMCADFVLHNWAVLKDKKVCIFSVSATKPTEDIIQEFYEKNFPGEIREKVTFFPLWGRFTELNFIDSFLTLVPKTAFYIKLFLAPSQKNRSVYQGLTEKFDHVERSALEPI